MMSSIASAMTRVFLGVSAIAPDAVITAPTATAISVLNKRMTVSLVEVVSLRLMRPVVVAGVTSR